MANVKSILIVLAMTLHFLFASVALVAQCNAPLLALGYDTLQTHPIDTIPCQPTYCPVQGFGVAALLPDTTLNLYIWSEAGDTVLMNIVVWAGCDTVYIDTCVVITDGKPALGLAFSLNIDNRAGNKMVMFSRSSPGQIFTTVKVAVAHDDPPIYILSEICPPLWIPEPKRQQPEYDPTIYDLLGRPVAVPEKGVLYIQNHKKLRIL